MDFKDLLESIIQISTKAGDKIIDIYNLPSNSLKVDYKSDSSPLTIADKASNKIIISGLKIKPKYSYFIGRRERN